MLSYIEHFHDKLRMLTIPELTKYELLVMLLIKYFRDIIEKVSETQ